MYLRNDLNPKTSYICEYSVAMSFIDPRLLHCTASTLDFEIPEEPESGNLEIGDNLQHSDVSEIGILDPLSKSTTLLKSMTSASETTAKIANTNPSFWVSIKIDSAKLIQAIQQKFIPLKELKKQQRYQYRKEINSSNDDAVTDSESSDKENVPPELASKKVKSKSLTSQYSKCNIQQLSKVLNLDQFHIILTKKVELDVLKTFERYCNFQLGHLTWVRSTKASERMKTVQTLHRIFNPIYGLTLVQLEIILKRGTYKIVQNRARRLRGTR